ncbi:MAG TPA: hypothetical protein PL182_11015, partial [Pseudobdellovibrionaceae bacterium]|nr:hypothetical protein [Pseudobdellovibrionaceae bacterium]
MKRLAEGPPRLLALVGFLILSMAGLAFGDAGVTYHGRLLNPNGSPVTSSSVQFLLQIRTPVPSNCLMYQETHVKDLSQTNGVFSITINDGHAAQLNTEPFTLDRVFQNRGVFQFATGKCAGAV